MPLGSSPWQASSEASACTCWGPRSPQGSLIMPPWDSLPRTTCPTLCPLQGCTPPSVEHAVPTHEYTYFGLSKDDLCAQRSPSSECEETPRKCLGHQRDRRCPDSQALGISKGCLDDLLPFLQHTHGQVQRVSTRKHGGAQLGSKGFPRGILRGGHDRGRPQGGSARKESDALRLLHRAPPSL